MSEYQYYEFQAIDRPLTGREMATLRGFSSRATITSTRFVNNYSYGSFKGNASEWMAKYFDAFLYLANWGTHEFMLRLPARVLSLETARRYCVSDAASARAKGDHVVLELRSEDEEAGEWIDEENGTLASLLPLRAELAVAICAHSTSPGFFPPSSASSTTATWSHHARRAWASSRPRSRRSSTSCASTET